MESSQPTFFAKIGEKPFKVSIKKAAVTGFRHGERMFRFTRAVPVKKDDVFEYIKGVGLKINKQLVKTRAKPWTYKTIKVSWVAKTLYVVLFPERDPIWVRDKKTKKWKNTGKLDKLHWTACDLRSYHVGCADTPVDALKHLILQVKATESLARESRTRERKPVIRWRCLLEPKEAKEMKEKALKEGIILGDLNWRTADWKNLGKWKL